jgi:hypothetical protein
MLLGVSGVVLAQAPQPGGGAQPRQQQGAQQPSPSQGAQQGQRSQGQQQSQVPSFDSADANRDGQLSRTEASDIDGLDFSKADVNENASIDRQEYTAAMSAPRSGAGSESGAGSRSGAGSSTAPRQPN